MLCLSLPKALTDGIVQLSNMSDQLSRRAVLSGSLLGVLTALAGCTESRSPESGSTATDASVTTTANPVSTSPTAGTSVTRTDHEDCESSWLNTPESDSLAFPDFPTELTRASAADWARTFEKAYRINDVRARYDSVETIFRADIVYRAKQERRYIVGISGMFKYTAENETADVAIGSWYEITPDRVRRVEETSQIRDGEPPPRFYAGSTVYCPPDPQTE